MTMDEREQSTFEDFKKLDINECGTSEEPKSNSNSVDKENINIVFIGHVGKDDAVILRSKTYQNPFRCGQVHPWRTAPLFDRNGR